MRFSRTNACECPRCQRRPIGHGTAMKSVDTEFSLEQRISKTYITIPRPTRNPYRSYPYSRDRETSLSSTRFPVRVSSQALPYDDFRDSQSDISSILSKPSRKIKPENSRIQSILQGVPAFTAATIWTSMVVYFLISYMTLRRLPDGSLPRVGDHYAAWPYISCLGAIHGLIFKLCAICTAINIVAAFFIDYYLGKDIPLGLQWRRGKTLLGCVSSAFLVALSFQSVNAVRRPGEPDNHMIYTTIHFASAFCAKFCDFMLSYKLQSVAKNYSPLIIAKRWKKLSGVVGFPCVIIFMTAVYGCDGEPEVHEAGTKCYKIATAGAIAEWILVFAWMNYLLALGFMSTRGVQIREHVLKSIEKAALIGPISQGSLTTKEKWKKGGLRILKILFW